MSLFSGKASVADIAQQTGLTNALSNMTSCCQYDFAVRPCTDRHRQLNFKQQLLQAGTRF